MIVAHTSRILNPAREHTADNKQQEGPGQG